MTTNTSSFVRRSILYFAAIYLLALLHVGYFAVVCEAGSGFSRNLYLYTTLLFNAALYMLPACIPMVVALFLTNSPRARTTLAVCSGVLSALTLGILTIDAIILFRFGYHINGLVINLLITPGGFDSMGLDSATLVPAIIGAILMFAFHIALPLFCLRAACVTACANAVTRKSALWTTACIFVVAVLVSLFSTGIADFYAKADVLACTNAYPITLTVRMRGFMKKIGCTEPPREEIMGLQGANAKHLNYPAATITRAPDRKKLNVIWIVAESMRADLLSPEIMPATWTFSQNALRLTQHYSGGNGTRPAMFSMFYGLHGLNWTAFLNCRRHPVLFDWLAEDNTQFLCQTSSDFSYPEFDATVFASMKGDQLKEHHDELPWKRDAELFDDMLQFIDKRDTSRPFFCFGFLESTHAPYSFPEETAVRKDYMHKINYATVSKDDAPQLYNRYANAAHYIDLQLKRLYDYLAAHPKLNENTIVIVTGDHGEEFFEKGRLGHNSTFVEEQIRPVMVMKLPGVKPAVISQMTTHADLIPTLAPFLGVQNTPTDYCIGQNILAPDFNKQYSLVCGWEIAFFISKDYKSQLPLGTKGGFFQKKVTRLDDSPCTPDEEKNFFPTHANQIFAIQQELNRFLDK